MPKRKRLYHASEEVNPEKEAAVKKEKLERKVVHGRKVLARTLKTARGFERQKLGRRIKLAVGEAEVERLRRELEVLKVLDVSKVAEAHFHKVLLKGKKILESGMLPGDVSVVVKKNDASPEEVVAIGNVTARLYNAKVVKEAMAQVLGSVYAVLGILDQLPKTAKSDTKEVDSRLRNEDENTSTGKATEENEEIKEANDAEDQQAAMGDEAAHSDEDKTGQDHNVDAGSGGESVSEDLSRYDALVGGSFDEDTDDEVDSIGEIHRPTSKLVVSKQTSDLSISRSESNESLTPPSRPKRTKRPQQPTKPGSTFLPTLMGGYWSGSESATDDEDTLPAPRKNRPGQQARQALWERKFGAKANHLKESGKVRDKDWDPRRGARSAGELSGRRGRGGARGGWNGGISRAREISTGENAIDVKPRARGMGKKDDAGPLHPSWEAAKKAKETKKMAAFQGKKVVFE